MKTRRINLAREVIVYPVVEPTEQFLEVLPMVTGEFETFVSGRGNDLYRIREYMPDDSARHVDWKATARTGALKVREFSREDERKLRIVFDNPAPGVLPPAIYERAVRLAASLGWHFHHEDVEVSFVAPGLEPTEDVFTFLQISGAGRAAGSDAGFQSSSGQRRLQRNRYRPRCRRDARRTWSPDPTSFGWARAEVLSRKFFEIRTPL